MLRYLGTESVLFVGRLDTACTACRAFCEAAQNGSLEKVVSDLKCGKVGIVQNCCFLVGVRVQLCL